MRRIPTRDDFGGRRVNKDQDVLLDIDNLHVYFDLPEGEVRAVHGVSYRVRRGGVLGVVGESGSGKSVTTQAVLGIVPRPGRISSGEIRFYRDKGGAPVEITRLEPDKKEMNSIRGGDISLVFQEPMGAFSPMRTVGAQMVEMLRIHQRVSRAEARERSVDMLGRVGISNPRRRIDQYSFELSGGMRQRAMIAMALLAGPSLVIADEPTTSLDVTIQAQILRLLKDLQEETGMSILFITHDLGVVAQIADEIAVMYLGKVVEFASAEELFHDPRHPYTVNLLKSITRIGSGKRRLSAIEGRIPSPFERPSGCPFHTRCPEMMPGLCDRFEPENVEIAPGHGAGCWKYADERPAQGAVNAL